MTPLGTAQVIRANSRHLPLADDSVDLVVTSPPYFALRSYQDGGEHYDGQIGDEPTPVEFVDSLLEVTRECVRVLKPSGSLWVNLGDKYAGSDGTKGGTAASTLGGGRSNGRARDFTAGTFDGGGRKPQTDVRPKSLIGIPWRYALRCIDELGLILRAEVIWSKPNGLPESVQDRVRRSHEQWFHFTLEPRYFSAIDEIREAHVRTWGDSPNGGHTYETMKAPGAKDANLPHALPNPLGKLPGSVWSVPTEPLKVPDEVAHAKCCGGRKRKGCEDGIDHFAAFPSEWPKRIIAAFSPAGVCTVCGEGRRPVVKSQRTIDGEPVELGAWERGGISEAAGIGNWRFATDRTLTGYACACNAPIASPTGRGAGAAADPSRETGRAGFNRERGDDEGVRIITRWEQRHEAQQLKDSPHRDAMAAEAGPAFAHYLRTDTTGARPVPEPLRAAWQARGWLCPAPAYVPAPTRPAVVLDPFGGTGTTAMVAKALGRHGITVDMSADYCRIAEWRTNDRNQLAKVLDIEKTEAPDPQQDDLLALLDTEKTA